MAELLKRIHRKTGSVAKFWHDEILPLRPGDEIRYYECPLTGCMYITQIIRTVPVVREVRNGHAC